MRRIQLILRAALAAALLAALPALAVPPQVMTYSGYLKTSAGAPVTASTTIWFRLYAASTGGASLWDQQVAVTPSSDGWFSAVLGTTTPLPFAILNQDLYLSLQVGSDAEFTQRARVTPSHAALTVDWGGVQGKPTCGAGAYLTLDGTGGLTCSVPASGSGGITSVSGSRGITATTTGGSVSLALPLCATTGDIMKWDGTSSTWGCSAAPPPSPGAACSAGQVLSWNGTAFQCVADAGLASVSVAGPITGNGTPGSPVGLVACPNAQILQYTTAGGWGCIPTPSGGGGGVTSVTAATGGGLVASPTTGAVVVGLPQTCSAGQIMKWSGTNWTCAADDAGLAGVAVTAPLTGTGAAGSPLALNVSGCAAGQILTLGVGGSWSCSTPPVASAISSGYLTAGDWGIFNAKAPSPGPLGCSPGQVLTWTGTAFSCVADANSGGTLTGLTGSGPITIGGTATVPTVNISQASNVAPGFLAAADWIAFNNKVSAISAGPRIAVGGTTTVPTVGLSGCAADGDILKYSTLTGWSCQPDANSGGTVVNVGANAPLFISGTPGGLPVVNMTPVDGLGTSGFLASADYVAFTNKQNRVTGTCAATQKVLGINADGTVACGTDIDTNTTYAAGAGLSLIGTTFSAAYAGTGGNLGTATTVARSDHAHAPLATVQLRPPDFHAEASYVPVPTLARVSLDGNAFSWRTVDAWTLGAGGALTVSVQVPGGVTSANNVTAQLLVAGTYPTAASTDISFGVMAVSAPGTGVTNTWSDYRTTGLVTLPAGGTQTVSFTGVQTYSFRSTGSTALVAGDLIILFIRNATTSTGSFHLLGLQLVFN